MKIGLLNRIENIAKMMFNEEQKGVDVKVSDEVPVLGCDQVISIQDSINRGISATLHVRGELVEDTIDRQHLEIMKKQAVIDEQKEIISKQRAIIDSNS